MLNNLAANAGDTGLIPGSGSSPGDGDGNPPECSCLRKPTERGTWRATGHGVAKNQTRPSDWATTITPLSIISYPKYFPTFAIIRLVFQRQLCWDVVGTSIQHTAHSKTHPKTSSDLCRHCEAIVRMAGTPITSKRVLWPLQPLREPRHAVPHPQVLNSQWLCSYTFSRVFYKWKYIACTLSCLTSCLSA